MKNVSIERGMMGPSLTMTHSNREGDYESIPLALIPTTVGILEVLLEAASQDGLKFNTLGELVEFIRGDEFY